MFGRFFRRRFSSRSHYIMAIVLAAWAGIISLFLPWRQETPSAFFTIAVVLSSWFGGLRAGLLCSLLSAVFWQAIFFSEAGPIDAQDLFNIGAFTFAGFVIGQLFSQLHQERARLARANQTLE